MIIAGACTSKLPLSGTTELWQTSEVTLPVLCASWPLLQGLCQSFRSLAWVALNGENASPLELVGVDGGAK